MELLVLRHFISWLLGGLLLYRIPLCSDEPASNADSAVTVIIPARNESQNLPGLLDSLRAQAVPHEVLVVDDDSEDETAAVAESYGAEVISAGPLPDGWSGKAWTCWQGAQAARGDRLVFVDADTTFEPDGLQRLLNTHEARGGLLTVQPYHRMKRLHEQFSLLFYVIMMASMGVFTPLGHRLNPRGAFGACVVCDRSRYLSAGGHGLGRASVMEDMVMGRAFRKAGISVWCLGGKGTISVRMYAGGLPQLVGGFGKSFATGARQVGLLPVILVVLWVSGLVVSSIAAGEALLFPSRASLPLLLLYALYAAQLTWMGRRLGNYHVLTAIFFPVSLAIFMFTMAKSLIWTLLVGRVSWKGRTLRTR